MKALSLVAAVLLLACVKPHERRLPEMTRIITLLDNRVSPDSLYTFLDHADVVIQTQAMLALAQLQDTLATDTLLARARRTDGSRLEDLVFALGQIGYGASSVTAKRKISDNLLLLWSAKTGTRARAQMLRAIGKTGYDNVHPLLRAEMADTSIFAAEAAMAYGIMAYRKLLEGVPTTSAELDRLTIPLLKIEEARGHAMYAAMRCANPEIAPYVTPHLKDGDAQIRMDAARALGAMKLDTSARRLDYINALVETASNDGDWRVRINAVNALASFKFSVDDLKKVYFLIAFEGRRDSSEHVRLSAIRAMPQSYKNDVGDENAFATPFYDTFIPAGTWREQAAILGSLATMIDVWNDARFTETCAAVLDTGNRYHRAQVVQAIGQRPNPRALPLLEQAVADSFALVRINAYGVCNAMVDRRAKALLRRGLDDPDATVVGVVADYLIDDPRHGEFKPEELALRIILAYKQLEPVHDAESRITILDGLGKLKTTQAIPILTSLLSDSNAALALAAARNLERITGEKHPVVTSNKLRSIDELHFARYSEAVPSVVVKTTTGEFVMEMFFDEAPLTVMNFLRLAEKRAFDGVTFHRVVPNFVVQGGDPTGTGWGGPGYTIRGEYNRRAYERGMVGMASAGKDTEGCQWFVTHSDQPHLNGRYTIFGSITIGMDVVDRLQVGDRIEAVRVR
jgi:cyclophilin family peptidyl-prolyl cis-trans isomerase